MLKRSSTAKKSASHGLLTSEFLLVSDFLEEATPFFSGMGCNDHLLPDTPFGREMATVANKRAKVDYRENEDDEYPGDFVFGTKGRIFVYNFCMSGYFAERWGHIGIRIRDQSKEKPVLAKAELMEAAQLLKEFVANRLGYDKSLEREEDYVLPPTEEYKTILSGAFAHKGGRSADKNSQDALNATSDIAISSIALMRYLAHRCEMAANTAPAKGLPAKLPNAWTK